MDLEVVHCRQQSLRMKDQRSIYLQSVLVELVACWLMSQLKGAQRSQWRMIAIGLGPMFVVGRPEKAKAMNFHEDSEIWTQIPPLRGFIASAGPLLFAS